MSLVAASLVVASRNQHRSRVRVVVMPKRKEAAVAAVEAAAAAGVVARTIAVSAVLGDGRSARPRSQ